MWTKDIDVVAIYRRPEKIAKREQERLRRLGHKLLYEIQIQGYWRNTYYPSTGQHVRQFVASHSKGPKGIQDVRQKVYKAVR